MKRNKLVLASGILYVIASGILPIISILAIILYSHGYDYLSEFGYNEATHEAYILVLLLMGFSVLLSLAKSIVLLIFGIKAIKKSKSFEDGKNNSLIAGMVLGYIFSLFNFGGDESFVGFVLILTGAILLSVAFSRLNNENQKIFIDTTSDDKFTPKVKDNQISKKSIDNLKNQVLSLQSLKEQNLISEEEYLGMLKKLIDSSVDNK